jgi:hypothetical protein
MQKTTFVTKASVTEFLQEDLNSVALCSDPELSDWAKSVASVFDSSDPNSQPDLLMMRSILVSEGMNLNDDVFLRSELMNSRSTGAHKPVNIEHSDESIVGHMLSTYAVSKSGKLISGPDLPLQPIDIVNEAVIYSYLFPQLSNDIKDLAASNELFVSVEAWFDTYDFVVGNNVIKRNESTAEILDDALRMNGGDGYFQGHKVGRALRGVRFGGVGIVATPANPESLILSADHVTNPSGHKVERPEAILASYTMGCVDQEEIMNSPKGDIKPVIEPVMAENNNSKLENNAIKSMLDRVSASVSQTESSVDEISLRLESLDKETLVYSRMSRLSNAGLSKVMIGNRLDRITDMSNEEFNEYLGDVSDLVRGSQESTEESVELEENTSETDVSEETSTKESTEQSTDELTDEKSDDSTVSETQEEDSLKVETEELLEVETTNETVTPESDTENTLEEAKTEELSDETSTDEALSETTETLETSQEESKDSTPEVSLTEVEDTDTGETETNEELAVVEDDIAEALNEVDLDSIIPVSPELGLPSADDGNNYAEKLSEVITNLLNQRKR